MRRPPVGLPDVAVIGGGIVGTATAAFLADAGASVVLYERTAVAAGASGRNSGVVQHPLDPILVALHVETLALYRELADRSDGAFDLPTEPAGLLHVTTDAAVARRLTDALRASHPTLDPAFLDAGEARRVEPRLGEDVAACRVSIGYPVAPASATRAYAALAERRGARILTEAAGVDVPAGAVVVAAGPWTPGLLAPAGTWRPIRPVWGIVADVGLADPPRHVLEEAEIDAAIEPGVVADAADHLDLAFSLVTAAGSSALGSTFLDAPLEPDAASIVPAIVERGARFVPALAAAPVRAIRVCARPVAVDGRPLVGAVPWRSRTFVAAGHGAWGISTGPACARMIADLVLGRAAGVPAELSPGRFGAPVGEGTPAHSPS